MNREEAFSEAVLGERVRAVDMPEGVFIDYQFNGWRINFPSGSSSGYSSKPHDDTVEWEVYTPPPPPVGWDMSKVHTVTEVLAPQRRRGRKAWQPPAEINDIDWQKPLEPGPVKLDVETVAWPNAPKPDNAVSEGWANFDANKGVDKPEIAASGWPVFNKGTSQ